MSVTSPRAASDFHHCRHLKCRAHKRFGGCTRWNPRHLLWKKIKHDILSVSKSVAWYQKYMHIKACLVTGYTPRVWRQVKMMFIPATGKVNYTQAKAYCTISLLSFIWKMMQEFKTRNITTETMGNVPYIYINLTTNQGSPHKPQSTRCVHIYRRQWKTGSYTWAFRDIKEASDSTSHDITHVAKWHGLENTLQWWFGSMLGGRKITATLTVETLEGSVAKCCSQRGSLPHSCEAWLKTNP